MGTANSDRSISSGGSGSVCKTRRPLSEHRRSQSSVRFRTAGLAKRGAKIRRKLIHRFGIRFIGVGL
jgi:hypothetical protein